MIMMRTIITLSHNILFFFLLSPAVDAELNQQQRLNSYPKLSRILKLDPSFTPVVAAIGCSIFFIIFFSIYVRYCSVPRHPTATAATTTVHCSSSTHEGIDPRLLETFPTFVYSSIKHLKHDDNSVLECAVCLSEFDHQDSLRLLPICNHVFHPQCIDAWLGSHVTCPVCRTRLTPEHRDGEVVIVIPDDEVNVEDELDESSASRIRDEFDLGERGRSCLGRCHSTGHSMSLVGTVGKDMERYTLRLTEDVRKLILANHGGMRRSSSYDVFGSAGRQPGEVKCQKF